jgi:hypothetical protein
LGKAVRLKEFRLKAEGDGGVRVEGVGNVGGWKLEVGWEKGST